MIRVDDKPLEQGKSIKYLRRSYLHENGVVDIDIMETIGATDRIVVKLLKGW